VILLRGLAIIVGLGAIAAVTYGTVEATLSNALKSIHGLRKELNDARQFIDMLWMSPCLRRKSNVSRYCFALAYLS
jgi:hypothetical protein